MPEEEEEEGEEGEEGEGEEGEEKAIVVEKEAEEVETEYDSDGNRKPKMKNI